MFEIVAVIRRFSLVEYGGGRAGFAFGGGGGARRDSCRCVRAGRTVIQFGQIRVHLAHVDGFIAAAGVAGIVVGYGATVLGGVLEAMFLGGVEGLGAELGVHGLTAGGVRLFELSLLFAGLRQLLGGIPGAVGLDLDGLLNLLDGEGEIVGVLFVGAAIHRALGDFHRILIGLHFCDVLLGFLGVRARDLLEFCTRLRKLISVVGVDGLGEQGIRRVLKGDSGPRGVYGECEQQQRDGKCDATLHVVTPLKLAARHFPDQRWRSGVMCALRFILQQLSVCSLHTGSSLP